MIYTLCSYLMVGFLHLMFTKLWNKDTDTKAVVSYLDICVSQFSYTCIASDKTPRDAV